MQCGANRGSCRETRDKKATTEPIFYVFVLHLLIVIIIYCNIRLVFLDFFCSLCTWWLTLNKREITNVTTSTTLMESKQCRKKETVNFFVNQHKFLDWNSHLNWDIQRSYVCTQFTMVQLRSRNWPGGRAQYNDEQEKVILILSSFNSSNRLIL